MKQVSVVGKRKRFNTDQKEEEKVDRKNLIEDQSIQNRIERNQKKK